MKVSSGKQRNATTKLINNNLNENIGDRARTEPCGIGIVNYDRRWNHALNEHCKQVCIHIADLTDAVFVFHIVNQCDIRILIIPISLLSSRYFNATELKEKNNH